MHDWVVAAGVIERNGHVLLVQNRRRDGHTDWSTPGGVVDPGETVLEGLTREVAEETGLVVREWHGPLYEVTAIAPDMGWRLRVEVHRALDYEGEVIVDDPDGIVVDAQFLSLDDCRTNLLAAWAPTHEPLLEWLTERYDIARTYDYRVEGATRAAMSITRLS